MSKKIAVIDGNSLMHRAFHAVPPTMNAPDGTPTNAVFGFISMFLKFVEVAHPDAVVCAFDAGRPAFRMEALEQYKAQRPPMDNDLKVQFPIIEELLESMNVPVVRVKGWEGDDILGTIAARDEKLGYETLLVTGDKDAYQLASDLTRIVTTKKGITDVAIYGPAEVEERYGVTPAQFPDFLGLKGDSSDNIPGVPGIGDKGAARLLQAYGSIDGIYENLDKLKGKQLQNLQENKDAAFISRRVATIVRDLDFPLDLEEVSFPDFDVQKVADAFHSVRFNAHLTKVLRLVGAEPVRQVAPLEWEPVLTGDQARQLVDEACAKGERVGVAFIAPEQESLFSSGVRFAMNTPEGTAVLDDDEGLAAFARVVEGCPFSTLDVKRELHRIYPADTSLQALVDDGELVGMDAFDLSLAGYVLNSSVESYSYDALMDSYLGGVLPETKDEQAQAAVMAAAARRLVEPLQKALEGEGSWEAYRDIDLPLVAVLCIMERTGAAVDADHLKVLGESTQAELDKLRARICELAGEEFNIDSPKQLSRILFEVIGLKPRKKNQRGYSTDASVLKELSSEHEVPGLVLRYRELAKIKSTYIDTLPRLRAGDGRVHTTFNETVTTTGRLSSSDPNLQNIPVRTEFGRQIRTCFVPLEKGERFLSADYSQIELRLLAHLSGDEHLVEAFCSGADFHASTAARVFGVPVEEVTPQLRSRAKAVNFGIVYGQQAFGLSQSLGIPFGEAKDMIDRYFEAYPGVRAYLDETVAQAKRDGYAVTMFGRKRHIPELKSKNAAKRGFGERTAMNHPMQGSAADIIKLAMRQVQDRLMGEGMKARLLVQVHDELDFSVPEDEVDKLTELVRDVMENVAKLRVPLLVDVQTGTNWAEAH
ncbi:MAG: DNA polymerase I [Eggerthellaceae bacterium]|nr:DNA polymerase I [Eggerthellaceae bacterium]